MTARPLPEAVEWRLQAALLDAYNHGWAVGARVKAPVGPDNHEAALRAAIAAAMAPGEPVAWGVFNGTSFKCAYDDERAAREDYPRYTVVPLYAAPLHSASAGEVDKARWSYKYALDPVRDSTPTPVQYEHDGTCCTNSAGMPNCYDPAPPTASEKR